MSAHVLANNLPIHKHSKISVWLTSCREDAVSYAVRVNCFITSYNYHKLNTWHLPLRNVLLLLLSISHFNRFIIRLRLQLVRYNLYHLVLTSLQGCHSIMAMGVSFLTRAVHGRPITKDWAIWPITAVRAHGKEGFRETDSSNCFAQVVYESFRN